MVVLEKPKSSAVLVIEAPAMRAPTICPFSKSVIVSNPCMYLYNINNGGVNVSTYNCLCNLYRVTHNKLKAIILQGCS